MERVCLQKNSSTIETLEEIRRKFRNFEVVSEKTPYLRASWSDQAMLVHNRCRLKKKNTFSLLYPTLEKPISCSLTKNESTHECSNRHTQRHFFELHTDGKKPNGSFYVEMVQSFLECLHVFIREFPCYFFFLVRQSTAQRCFHCETRTFLGK